MVIKAKKIRVEVGPVPVKKQDGIIYFKDFQSMNEILTATRIELLETIREKQPESIYRLAELVGRDQGNVTRDVNILEQHGFVEVKRTKEGKRMKSEPQIGSETIEMVIRLGAGTFGMAREALDKVSEEFKEENIEKNKEYAQEKYRHAIKEAAKPIKRVVKDIAEEFDIVTKEKK